MGRPRKRRRDGEADEPTEPSAEGPIEYANVLHEFPQIPNPLDFSQVSPPPLQDANSSAGSTGHEVVTPAHYDFGVSDSFGMFPDSNLEYGIFLSIKTRAYSVVDMRWIHQLIHGYGTLSLYLRSTTSTMLLPSSQMRTHVHVFP
jgi:hypothetical protein